MCKIRLGVLQSLSEIKLLLVKKQQEICSELYCISFFVYPGLFSGVCLNISCVLVTDMILNRTQKLLKNYFHRTQLRSSGCCIIAWCWSVNSLLLNNL